MFCIHYIHSLLLCPQTLPGHKRGAQSACTQLPAQPSSLADYFISEPHLQLIRVGLPSDSDCSNCNIKIILKQTLK